MTFRPVTLTLAINPPPATPHGTRVAETFETEGENSAGQQKQGWQRILNNFKG